MSSSSTKTSSCTNRRISICSIEWKRILLRWLWRLTIWVTRKDTSGLSTMTRLTNKLRRESRNCKASTNWTTSWTISSMSSRSAKNESNRYSYQSRTKKKPYLNVKTGLSTSKRLQRKLQMSQMIRTKKRNAKNSWSKRPGHSSCPSGWRRKW